MTLDEARAAVEKPFAQTWDSMQFFKWAGALRPYSKAPTGEPFVTIVGGGEKGEGEPFPPSGWFGTPEDAVEQWLGGALAFVRRGGFDGSETVYWRAEPTIERDEVSGKYMVYSRLLISKRPIPA